MQVSSRKYPETVGSGNYTPVAPLQQPSGFPCNSVTVPSTYNYYTTDGTYIQVQVYANQASPASSWFTITFPDGHNASGPYLYMGGQVTSISRAQCEWNQQRHLLARV